MKVRPSGVRVGMGVALTLALTLVASCTVDAESNTGIRVNVTYHDSVPPAAADGYIDHLRFYVAVQYGDSDLWVLNSAGAGIEVDVIDRDLFADPYQLLVARKDARMRAIRVVVVGERDGVGVLFGQLSDPSAQAFEQGSILQRTITLRPPETSFAMSWTVAGCLTSSTMRNEEYDPFVFVNPNDRDCDTYATDEDCDDENSEVHPGFEEGYECDGVDNNCDGIVDPLGNEDFDGDGYTSCQGDCNDEVYEINPEALEVCDGLDNDCNGKCDDAPDIDGDGDGFSTCGTFIDHDSGACNPAPPDCDDSNPEVNPGAEELCNGVDDNCNELCDETWDPDGDGYTECGSTNPDLDDAVCTDLSPELVDCDPWDPAVNPGAEERCDGYDTNCDDVFSNADSFCYEWGSGEQECHPGGRYCIEDGGGETWGSCNADNSVSLPLTRCGVWPYCEESPTPEPCMDQAINTDDTLVCHLGYNGMFNGGICGSTGERPQYDLPFGFSGNIDCTWHLLLNSPPNNYQEVGLVDPAVPGEVASDVLYSCEAALVAMPLPAFTTSDPGTITGTLSFYYDNGQGNFFAMEMEITVTPMTSCEPGGALYCNLLSP